MGIPCNEHFIDASAVCVRCGRGMCEQCIAAEGVCSQCLSGGGPRYVPPSTGLWRWVMMTFITLAVFAGGCAGCVHWLGTWDFHT